MISFTTGVFVLIMLIFWYSLWKLKCVGTEKQHKKLLHCLDGNGPTKVAKMVLSNYKETQPKTADEHYQLGALYDYHFGDSVKAAKHYKSALEKAVKNEPQQVQFILDKINDRIEQPVEIDDYHVQPIQIIPPENVVNIPVTTSWHIDTQNVHDSLLSDTVASQYYELQNLNKRMDLPDTDINSIMECVNSKNAKRMLAHIRDYQATVTKLNGDSEIKLVIEVWKQASLNQERVQSFITSVEDCWNNGSPVCITGRISRIISSLAHLVPNTNIGILKTKEACRNEIFHTAGQILENILDRPGLRDIYNLSEDQEKIKKIIEEAKLKIYDMIHTYQLSDDEKSKLTNECYSALE